MADTPKTDTSDLQAQMKVLGDDIARLTEIVRALAKDAAGDMRSKMSEKAGAFAEAGQGMAERAAEKAKDEFQAIEKHITDKPVQSALIAFLIGMVLGSMNRR